MSLLYERPMHPYEMKTNMLERGHDRVMKINVGSLYDTVARLEKLGFITEYETSREGNRPERTVYAITDAGRDELTLWVREIVAQPAVEYPTFAAALAFILVLDPPEAIQMLQRRVSELTSRTAAEEALLAGALHQKLPRMVLIESEFQIAMLKTELDFTKNLVHELQTGKLRWPTIEDFQNIGYEPHPEQVAGYYKGIRHEATEGGAKQEDK